LKKQSFLHGSVILVLAAFTVKLIGAVFRIPLTNMLGGTGMGIFSCAYGVFLPVYAVSVTGLPVAVAKMVAESSAAGDFRRVRSIFSVSLRSFSLLGGVCTIAVMLLSYPICNFVIGLPSATPAVIAIAPSLYSGCICAVYRGYYEGLRNMYPTALSQVAEAVSKLFFGLGAALAVFRMAEHSPETLKALMTAFGFSPDFSVSLATFTATVSVFGVTLSTLVGTAFLVLRKKLGGDGIPYTVSGRKSPDNNEILRELMKTAVPIASGSLVTTLTSLVDLVTITNAVQRAAVSAPSHFAWLGLAEKDLGSFFYGSFNGLAITVFNLVPSLTNMFGKGVIPSIAEAHSSGDTKKLCQSAESAFAATAFIAIPAGLGISVLAPEILGFLFSSRESEILIAAESMRWLGLAVIPVALTFPVFSVLQAVGRADIPVKAMIVGVAVKFVGNFILVPIPEINITGAGISTLICYIAVLIAAIIPLKRHIKAKIRLVRSVLHSLAGGISCAVTAFCIHTPLENLLGGGISLPLTVISSGCIHLIFTLLIVHFAKTSPKYKKI